MGSDRDIDMRHTATKQIMHDEVRPIIGSHPNLRCLGGLNADQGQRVRPGRFLRGPLLQNLSVDEAERLASLDPALIIDFRGVNEALESPAHLPQSLRDRRVTISIEPSATPRFRDLLRADAAEVKHEDVIAAMVETYRDFIRLHASVYMRFLRLLLEVGSHPVLFHCTAGKDRTGLATALILSALGSPREEIMRDYLATGMLWQPDERLRARMPEAAHPGVFGVYPAYLQSAFDELDRQFGGVRAFVNDAMGGETKRKRWSALHLDPA